MECPRLALLGIIELPFLCHPPIVFEELLRPLVVDNHEERGIFEMIPYPLETCTRRFLVKRFLWFIKENYFSIRLECHPYLAGKNECSLLSARWCILSHANRRCHVHRDFIRKSKRAKHFRYLGIFSHWKQFFQRHCNCCLFIPLIGIQYVLPKINATIPHGAKLFKRTNTIDFDAIRQYSIIFSCENLKGG